MNKIDIKKLPIKGKNNVYSVDMVRLRVRVSSLEVEKYFSCFSQSSDIDYYETCQIKKYRHNWTFKTMDFIMKKANSFWMGYQHNMEQKALKHWLVIEFNPNKVDMLHGYLNKLLKRFYSSYKEVQIVSVDLACDLPININNVFCGKGNKHIKKLFDYGGDNKTIYIGEGPGRIKIYNKARELGLEGENRTRYEITMVFDNSGCVPMTIATWEAFEICTIESLLVPIYVLESYQFDMTLDGTDRGLIYSVLNGFPIEELPRRKKEKIKKILSQSAGNTLDSNGFVQSFRQYFKNYMLVIV